MQIDKNMKIGAMLPPVSRRFKLEMFGAGGVKTIHNDAAAAAAEGLPTPIAVGPQVAALIFKMMRQSFGPGWVVGGRTALTFRRPTPVDEEATGNGRLIARTTEYDGRTRLEYEVWVELPDGEKPIVGTASALV